MAVPWPRTRLCQSRHLRLFHQRHCRRRTHLHPQVRRGTFINLSRAHTDHGFPRRYDIVLFNCTFSHFLACLLILTNGDTYRRDQARHSANKLSARPVRASGNSSPLISCYPACPPCSGRCYGSSPLGAHHTRRARGDRGRACCGARRAG
jgi:hypothetical protein